MSSDQSSVEKTDENDSKSSDEASPSRKFAAGIKIPGLLEGLSRSKVGVSSCVRVCASVLWISSELSGSCYESYNVNLH